MDFYVSSLAARIPCTRLHRQIQDPRGRSVIGLAVSSDGRVAAMATYPREHRSIESSINVLFKDGKAARGSNYHKAVLRQLRLAEKNNELEQHVEQYIHHSLQMDALGEIVKEVGLTTPSLRHIIKDNNVEIPILTQPIIPCAVIIFDTMYFNPVEEFIYGYKANAEPYANGHNANHNGIQRSLENGNATEDAVITHPKRCFFKPSQIEFCCDDTLLVLTSPDSGVKVYSLDSEYVQLMCHYRPHLKQEVILESLKVLKCDIVMADLPSANPELPPIFVSSTSVCDSCKASVLRDADYYGNDVLPYTVVLECVIHVTMYPPFLAVIHSKWPNGDVSIVSVQQVYNIVEIQTIGFDFLVAKFKARTTNTKEFLALDHVHRYWFLEPYIHDHTEYLIQCDKPVKSGYTKTRITTDVESKDYLEYHSLVAVYSPDYNLYIMDPKGNRLGHATVPVLEEGYFNIDVNRDGSMIAMVGTESIIVYRLLLSKDEAGAISVELVQHTRFPHVIGVGRREEILCACFGRDLGNRWMYVSVARGSVDAVLYVVDITDNQGKEPVKRTLNMNSAIFPCVVGMVATDNFLLVMPRHQRFLIQLTQEHMDNSDDIYSRNFCHFPALTTNKEAITVYGPITDYHGPPPDKFDLLILERERQIKRAKKSNPRFNVSRWMDALYHYDELCMYKDRTITLGMDPHDFLLPPLRRVRQQFPFSYDAKQFYDPLVGVEFTGSPGLMRAQCYEWVRESIARAGLFNRASNQLDIIYGEKLHVLDYVYAKICISQWDNPSEILFSMRTNDFLRLQLVNFPKITQRLDIQCDSQGLIAGENTLIYRKIIETIPLVIKEEIQEPALPPSLSLERRAFMIIREQMTPELMDIPMHKVKKIIRDRVYRLRKKLASIERLKANQEMPNIQHEFSLDEILNSDCRFPSFKDGIEPRDVAINEFALRLRLKVLTSFHNTDKEDDPDSDCYEQT